MSIRAVPGININLVVPLANTVKMGQKNPFTDPDLKLDWGSSTGFPSKPDALIRTKDYITTPHQLYITLQLQVWPQTGPPIYGPPVQTLQLQSRQERPQYKAP